MIKRVTATVLLIIALVALFVASEALYSPTGAQTPNKVGLVVRFSDTEVFTTCVDYEPGLTGEGVLDQAGLSLAREIYGGLGAAICKIEDVGCDYPQQDCFCQCTGKPPCEYWAYYHLEPQQNEWVYSGMGASWHSVQPGDVEGWAWGSGDAGGSEVEPPLFTFEELCLPPTPPVVDFTADPRNLTSGQCSVLRWTVQNAEVVVLDGEGVRAEDSRYVCPPQTETYELRVLNAAGEFAYQATINVIHPTATPWPSATPTTAPTATSRPPSAPAPPAQTPTIQPSPTNSPSPSSPTATPSASVSSTVVAMLIQPTPPSAAEELSEPPDQPGTQDANSEAEDEETVGLSRILLLLGVSAGTVGFGAIVFVAIVVMLIAIYLQARSQFADHQSSER